MYENIMSQYLVSPMCLFYFTIFISFSIPLLWRHRKLPYPPGPNGLPVIGNMLMMDQLTHRGLTQLAKIYGGIFHLRMGRLHLVTISTREMAQEVLQAQDIVFSNRPATVAVRYLTYDRADMAFAHYGPFWRQMRKICVMKIFSHKRAESWASVREEVDAVVKTVMGRVGKSINIGELVFALTRNIIFKAAFGSDSCEGQDDFVKILQEFSKLFGAFFIGDFIPWLGWTTRKKFEKRLVDARSSLDGFIDKIINEHIVKKKKANGENEVANVDMVDELMAYFSEDSANDLNNVQPSIHFTRDHVKALIMDVMFGGTETVASAIEWTMAELMKSPFDIEKVQQELADVVGLHRRVEESDIGKLTYLKCVIKETLRMHPPIPLLLHETSEDCVVAGYFIPSKSRVTVNAYAIGRDPAAWAEPELFYPGRFLEEDAPDFKGCDFEFIPFGSGRRSCPGMQLGLYALELAVAHLMHCFAWELPDGMVPSELDMSDLFGLTAPRAVRLVAIPSYRLNCL